MNKKEAWLILSNFFKEINILTIADTELPLVSGDVEMLENLLEVLKKDSTIQPLAYCYVQTILLATKEDLFSLIKMVETSIHNEEASDFKEDLRENLDALKNLLMRCEKLEEEFRPFLFCPALETER